jgi:epoxyqueuosine reductase QueG
MPRSKKQINKENISYTITDVKYNIDKETNIETLLSKFEKEEIAIDTNCNKEHFKELINYDENTENDFFLTQVKDYEINYTSKQVILINDYYKLGNTSKMKKVDIIERIIEFENNDENYEIVNKRQTLWYYIDELKKDAYTRKFVWSF